MTATVLPLLQRCPACEGLGTNPHRPQCEARGPEGAWGCLCLFADCELCAGAGRVEPRHVTVWRFDMGREVWP